MLEYSIWYLIAINIKKKKKKFQVVRPARILRILHVADVKCIVVSEQATKQVSKCMCRVCLCVCWKKARAHDGKCTHLHKYSIHKSGPQMNTTCDKIICYFLLHIKISTQSSPHMRFNYNVNFWNVMKKKSEKKKTTTTTGKYEIICRKATLSFRYVCNMHVHMLVKVKQQINNSAHLILYILHCILYSQISAEYKRIL